MKPIAAPKNIPNTKSIIGLAFRQIEMIGLGHARRAQVDRISSSRPGAHMPGIAARHARAVLETQAERLPLVRLNGVVFALVKVANDQCLASITVRDLSTNGVADQLVAALINADGITFFEVVRRRHSVHTKFGVSVLCV